MLQNNTDLLLVYEAPESFYSDISAKSLDIVPIGRDGLVFLVNKNNPVDNLTADQLIDIYTGEITDWSQVGGVSGKIAVFQRNEDSGSQTLFRKPACINQMVRKGFPHADRRASLYTMSYQFDRQ